MADIELVIKLPEELLSKINDENYQSIISWYDTTLYYAILSGMPLPKKHGRLIDADALMKLYGLEDATKYGNETAEQQTHSYDTMMMYEIADMLDDAPTIIEADKENEE